MRLHTARWWSVGARSGSVHVWPEAEAALCAQPRSGVLRFMQTILAWKPKRSVITVGSLALRSDRHLTIRQ
jgi:hypothetical protein